MQRPLTVSVQPPSGGVEERAARAPASARSGRARRGSFSQRWAGYLFIAPALVYLLLTVLLPILNTFKISFESTNFKTRTTEFVGADHYFDLFADPLFWSSFKNTVLFAGGSTIGHVVLGTAFALLLHARWAAPAIRNFVRGLLILPWLFSLAAAALIWGLLYDPTGPINYLLEANGLISEPVDFLGSRDGALWYLVIINIWKFYPFYMVMILGGLQSIPEELYEAAQIDGAGAVRRFWHVTLPMLRPVLVTATTIDMITTFATFDLVKIMTNGGPQRSTETLAFYIWQVGFRDVNLGYGAAMSVMMLLMLSIATLVYIKFIVRRAPGHASGSDI